MEKAIDKRFSNVIDTIYAWIAIGDGLGMLFGIVLGVVLKSFVLLGIGLVLGFGMILAIVPTIEA
jgi:hypothetical protein